MKAMSASVPSVPSPPLTPMMVSAGSGSVPPVLAVPSISALKLGTPLRSTHRPLLAWPSGE